jgi:hypothetical protein
MTLALAKDIPNSNKPYLINHFALIPFDVAVVFWGFDQQWPVNSSTIYGGRRERKRDKGEGMTNSSTR